MPPRVRGDDVEAAYRGWNHAAMATTAGGDQPRTRQFGVGVQRWVEQVYIACPANIFFGALKKL